MGFVTVRAATIYISPPLQTAANVIFGNIVSDLEIMEVDSITGPTLYGLA